MILAVVTILILFVGLLTYVITQISQRKSTKQTEIVSLDPMTLDKYKAIDLITQAHAMVAQTSGADLSHEAAQVICHYVEIATGVEHRDSYSAMHWVNSLDSDILEKLKQTLEVLMNIDLSILQADNEIIRARLDSIIEMDSLAKVRMTQNG